MSSFSQLVTFVWHFVVFVLLNFLQALLCFFFSIFLLYFCAQYSGRFIPLELLTFFLLQWFLFLLLLLVYFIVNTFHFNCKLIASSLAKTKTTTSTTTTAAIANANYTIVWQWHVATDSTSFICKCSAKREKKINEKRNTKLKN